MLSLNPTKPPPLLNHHHQFHLPSSFIQHQFGLVNLRTPNHHHHHLKPISAKASPPSTPPTNQKLYQPLKPPPSQLPSQFRSLDLEARLDILRNRLGLWFDYATLIPSILQEGFSPSSLEEVTGISGVDQNRLVVAAQVRETLSQSDKLDPDTLSFFDNGGAEVLYEIRLLSATQRADAARFIVNNRFDAREAQELARSIKDFPRRRGDKGWEFFNYVFPGDCLAFMYFRQSREHKNPSDQRTSALEKALEVAQTDKAKERILDELKVNSDGSGEVDDELVAIKVPVVRLKTGEVSEATMVVILPACKAEEGEAAVVEAPMECKTQGEFGVVVAEKGWKRWVVLPGWDPVAKLGKGGIVVEFMDARVLPWKVKKWYKEEPILVVVDRENKEVGAEDGFYLISNSKEGDNGFKVERGSRLKELGVSECLGNVVIVVRPPKDEIEDQLADEDWE